MKKILSILLISILSLTLIGCGSSSNIIKSLNDAVQEELNVWVEQDGHSDFTISKIQSHLSDYTFISSGDTEFISTDGSTEYTNQIVGYKSYSDNTVMSSTSDIKYALVYDKVNQKYYSVEISYETTKFKEQYEYDYPVFSNAKEIK